MDFEKIKEIARTKDASVSIAEQLLELDGSGKGFVCPVCSSGTGKTGTGISHFTADDGTERFTCWACSEIRGADVFELIGKTLGISDFTEQAKVAAQLLNITADDTELPPRVKPTHKPQDRPDRREMDKEAARLYREARANIEALADKPELQRGISLSTLKEYGCGYCKEWPIKNGQKWEALLFPTDVNSLVIRNANRKAKDRYRYNGTAALFNLRELNRQDTSAPVFVVEGAIDALSILDVGGRAVAMNSASNINQVCDALKIRKQRGQRLPDILIALDDDETGRKQAAKLQQLLKEENIAAQTVTLSTDGLDANDLLMQDRESFAAIVAGFDPAQVAATDYQQSSVSAQVDLFLQELKETGGMQPLPCGIEMIDKSLEGGFFSGLYVLGAVPSAGKSTLALWIAETMAAQGHDVLFFALEMKRSELMAKSISRIAYSLLKAKQKSANKNGGVELRQFESQVPRFSGSETDFMIGGMQGEINAFTAMDILSYRVPKLTENRELMQQTFDLAVTTYRATGRHLWIAEAGEQTTAASISEQIGKHIQLTGRRPFVVVDYLQILSPQVDSGTDKQNTDAAVKTLSNAARKHDVPILAISSFNRASYGDAVTMAAFKESGTIEYGADVLLGLQYFENDKKGFDYESARNQFIRKVELKVLKSRMTYGSAVAQLNFIPRYSYFEEAIHTPTLDEPFIEDSKQQSYSKKNYQKGYY